jgi:hypothetical protein
MPQLPLPVGLADAHGEQKEENGKRDQGFVTADPRSQWEAQDGNSIRSTIP